MEQRPSWEANRFSASQEISAFYGTQISNTVFKSTHHLSLSWATSIQPKSSHPSYWRHIWILFSQLRLGLPRGLFLLRFLTKTPLLSPIRATCPYHLIYFILSQAVSEQNTSYCLHIPIVTYVLFCICFTHLANWHSSATLVDVFRVFSSVVRLMPWYNSQRWGTARTLPN